MTLTIRRRGFTLLELVAVIGVNTILSLYYRDEMTLRDIAKVIGLHESRISQIKAQAILRLRGCMAKLWPAAQYGRPQTYGRT